MRLCLVLPLTLLLSYCTCLQDDAQNAKQARGSILADGKRKPPSVVDENNSDDVQSKWDELSEDGPATGHHKTVDQEALVGGASAMRELHNLSPEQAAEQIKNLVVAMDTDKDGLVNKEELVEWLERSEVKASLDESHMTFVKQDSDRDGFVSLDEFQTGSTGPEELAEIREVVQKKFSQADHDKDGRLNEAEFSSLATPTHDADMLEHLVDDQLAMFDTDSDGYVTMDEYVGVPIERNDVPEWVERERSEFTNEMDKDGDGRLDRDEVRAWLISEEAGFVVEEAEHLIHTADLNKDGQLNTEEILREMDMFLDSPANNFQRTHEEL